MYKGCMIGKIIYRFMRIFFLMGEKRDKFEREPHVDAYGHGVLPTYFPGSSRVPKVEYSLGAKIVGFLTALGIILFLSWVFLSMLGFI